MKQINLHTHETDEYSSSPSSSLRTCQAKSRLSSCWKAEKENKTKAAFRRVAFSTQKGRLFTTLPRHMRHSGLVSCAVGRNRFLPLAWMFVYKGRPTGLASRYKDWMVSPWGHVKAIPKASAQGLDAATYMPPSPEAVRCWGCIWYLTSAKIARSLHIRVFFN